MPEFRIEKIPSQKGKICIVTGSNTGLGYEAAKVLAGKEMKVILACRDKGKAGEARKRILMEHPGSVIEIMLVDLSSLSSVRSFVLSFLTHYTRLDLLINNAGIMMPPYSKTEDGFESQIGINFFSHFLLTGLLFNTIVNTPGSRIVTLASIAHKKAFLNFEDLNWEKNYRPLQAYRQSKLACLIFAFELQRRIDKSRAQNSFRCSSSRDEPYRAGKAYTEMADVHRQASHCIGHTFS